MSDKKKKARQFGHGVVHPSARPMQVLLDKYGVIWLCDKDVDPEKAFEEQNCWTCDEVLFTRGG